MISSDRDQPLPVAAVIPAFNSGGTIERALRSVLAQPSGARPAEIIVVDDCSTDDTGEVARRLGARVLRHESNRGAAAARNTAIAATEQPWIALLDADDEWLPNRLAALWPRRASHVLVSGSCVSFYDDDPTRTPDYVGPLAPGAMTLSVPDVLIPRNLVVASGSLVRRDAVLAAGGFDASLRYAEDWDLWLRVLENGTGLLVGDVVALYHRHAGQKSWRADGPPQAHRRIIAACASRPWWTSSVAGRWSSLQRWSLVQAAARDHRWRTALRHVVAHPPMLRSVAVRRLQFGYWQWRTWQLGRAAVRGRPTALNRLLAERRAGGTGVAETSPDSAV